MSIHSGAFSVICEKSKDSNLCKKYFYEVNTLLGLAELTQKNQSFKVGERSKGNVKNIDSTPIKVKTILNRVEI